MNFSPLIKQTAFNASSATVELVNKIRNEFPDADISTNPSPLADEDVSLEVVLPKTMEEIHRVRERLNEWVIELQEKYGVLILASAVPRN
jgi:hypothetical protein